MNKYTITVIVLIFLSMPYLQGQRYSNALGLRGGGNEIGLTFQQRIAYQSTIEGLLTFSTNHYTLTGLYEFHQPMLTRGLNFYVGGGPHFGRLFKQGEIEANNYFGLSGILGLEWKFLAMPVLLSADLRPQFHLNHVKSMELRPGISVRYILTTQKEINKKTRLKSKGKARASEPDNIGGKVKHRAESWWERNFQNKQRKKRRLKKKKRKQRLLGN